MFLHLFGVQALILLSFVTMSCGVNGTRIKMAEQKPINSTEATSETSKGTSNQKPGSVKSQNPKQSETTQTTPSNPSQSSSPPAVTNPNEPQPDARWESEIKHIVKERCSRCHSYFAEYKFVVGQRLDIIPRLTLNPNPSVKVMPDPGSPEGLAMTPTEKQILSQYLEGKQ